MQLVARRVEPFLGYGFADGPEVAAGGRFSLAYNNMDTICYMFFLFFVSGGLPTSRSPAGGLPPLITPCFIVGSPPPKKDSDNEHNPCRAQSVSDPWYGDQKDTGHNHMLHRVIFAAAPRNWHGPSRARTIFRMMKRGIRYGGGPCFFGPHGNELSGHRRPGGSLKRHPLLMSWIIIFYT